MHEKAYLESNASRVLLKRASVISGSALAVYGYSESGESDQVAACGTCPAACSYVSKTPWGKQACRRSREDAAAAAIRRKTPVPFICHMGFSGVAVSALSNSKNWALIIGPYYPDSIPDSVDREACEGLSVLIRRTVDSLPFTLEDVPRANAQAMPVLAEWTRDALTAQYTLPNPSDTAENHDAAVQTLDAVASRRGKEKNGTSDATALLTALLANDTKRAGHILKAALAEPARKKKQEHAAQRARCLMLVASILEEAESGGIDTAPCWERMGELTESLYEDDLPLTWHRAVMHTLKPLRRITPKASAPLREFTQLDTLLDKHLADGITLQEAARELKQNPTTLTKRLQRHFGLSYSDYIGRLRVDRAKHLFQSTNMTVAAVAKRVGLKDPSNFSKLFKKHAGKSPGAYRNQIQQNGKR